VPRRLLVLGVSLVVAAPLAFLGLPASAAPAVAKPYDFNGDGYPELAVGAPYLRVGSVRDAGGVVVLPASSSGLSSEEKVITPPSAGVPGASEKDDEFGSVLASADLDRDGYADLVIGAHRENDDRGRVTVVRGAAAGYATTGSAIYDQATKGVPGRSEDGDYFGSAVSLRDHDDDGDLDLSVGASGENGDDGAVTTLEGVGKTFTTKDAKALGLESLGHAHPANGYLGETLGQ